jgi:pyruvate dehydrogenase subunit E1
VPFLSQKLAGATGPFIATSDYDHLVPDQIRQWIPGDYHVLGADGFGFSDTRAAARRFFKIDAASVVTKALEALAKQGQVDRSLVSQAIDRYDLLNVRAGNSGAQGGDA